MTLGLDLQGGSNVLLEVDRKDLRDLLIQQQIGRYPRAPARCQDRLPGHHATENGVSVRITNATERPGQD